MYVMWKLYTYIDPFSFFEIVPRRDLQHIQFYFVYALLLLMTPSCLAEGKRSDSRRPSF